MVGGLAAGVVLTGPADRAAAAVSHSSIYVDNRSGENCSDTASESGSEAQPFCTIAAAAAVVQPGQTVFVEPGAYAPVTISVSGTASEPITFQGAAGGFDAGFAGVATVESTGPSIAASDFLISGASNVVITGFTAGLSASADYEVTGSSSNITINETYATENAIKPVVEVDDASGVTVSRSTLENGTGVQVDAGASGVVITGNTFDLVGQHPAVTVTGAPGTDITGNTIAAQCGPAIDVAAASADASIENNIATGHAGTAGACPGSDDATAITVDPSSTAGTTSDYNLINPAAFPTAYDWGGSAYPATAAGLASFQGATSQGAHDIAADPMLNSERHTSTMGRGAASYYLPATGSPAIDSANSAAPGELPSDQVGDPRESDPNVSTKGIGVASGSSTIYYDRGAMEVTDGPGVGFGDVIDSGPLTATASFIAAGAGWDSNGLPETIFEYWWNDAKYPDITTSLTDEHTFTTAGLHTVAVTLQTGQGGNESSEMDIVVGADYTPVTPTRILDTRNGTGLAAGAVPANGTITLPLATIDGVPATSISAVAMNVTVTQPTAAGVLSVLAGNYPSTGTTSSTSNLNFSAGETVPNLVTVQVLDGEVSFHNTSKGTVQVVADLEGFYGPGGYGFEPKSPVRVLDTRNGTGATKAPVGSGKVLKLNLSGKVPAGTAAVVLNTTVTGPQKAGVLTVYPDSPTAPTASNLNFTAGETVANLVIVPLNNGIADLYNRSGGSVNIVADLSGYFASGAPDSFVPYAPTRILDTRTAGQGPVKSGGTVDAYPDTFSGCAPGCANPVAAVVNITVTAPTKAGYLTAYGWNDPRPATSSLNFTAGKTIPNLAIVPGAAVS
ncbi:MAG TPA: right-handed parallel beta-helix repeat-containing protein, partial [Trebonia sp.]